MLKYVYWLTILTVLTVRGKKLFLTREQKMVRKLETRIDHRKERMKENIRECLLNASGLQDFTQKMKLLGVEVIKSRGISFIDDKKMYVKGSELGYSLSTIEKILSYSLEKRQQLHQKLEQQRKQMTISKYRQQLKPTHSEINKFIHLEKQPDLCEALEILLRTERDYSQVPSELFRKKRKRKHL